MRELDYLIVEIPLILKNSNSQQITHTHTHTGP